MYETRSDYDASKVPMTGEFWRDRKVLITGHTGFKGSWLCLWLHRMGAKVQGYSLPRPLTPVFMSGQQSVKLSNP